LCKSSPKASPHTSVANAWHRHPACDSQNQHARSLFHVAPNRLEAYSTWHRHLACDSPKQQAGRLLPLAVA
jgi:hypothetical protein